MSLAAEVSRRSQQGQAHGPELDVLLFTLWEQQFALPLSDVNEVVRAVASHVLPNAPAVVEGIIDVRGEIVPVLDLRSRFGLPAKPVELSDHFVLASAGARQVCVRVDRAMSVARLRVLHMEDALHLPRGVEHIAGVASVEGGLVLLHDLAAFLSEAERIQLGAALQERP